MAPHEHRRDPAVATNRSTANERRLFAINGFHFDDLPDKDMKASLKTVYPHSGARLNVSNRIQGNLLHLLRYVYFFRRFYGNKTANISRLAQQDLQLDDPYTWGKIFTWYIAARQNHRPAGTVPSDATPADRLICEAADRIIGLTPTDGPLSDGDQNDLIRIRAEWKKTIRRWKTMRNEDEPYLPNGDVLLMQLLEPTIQAVGPPQAQMSVAPAPGSVPSNPAITTQPQHIIAPPANPTINNGPQHPAFTPSNHANNNITTSSPQLYNLFHPQVAQRLAYIFNQVQTNPHEGLQLLENVVNDVLVPMDMRKLCYNLGMSVSHKLQADLAQLQADHARFQAAQAKLLADQAKLLADQAKAQADHEVMASLGGFATVLGALTQQMHRTQ